MKIYILSICLVAFAVGFLLWPSGNAPVEPIKAFTGAQMSSEPSNRVIMFEDFDMQACADELLCDIRGGV